MATRTHGVSRHRCHGAFEAMCARLSQEVAERRKVTGDALARAVDEINARRPDAEAVAYRAVEEALRGQG